MKRLPFVTAIAQARARGVALPDAYYGDYIGVARSLAFSASGLASIEQVQGVLDVLNQTLEDGDGFREFKAKVRKGEVDLNLPDHRIELIYRNHVQTAYNRGRCESFEKNAELRPYLMYSAINDSRTRPRHAEMDGHIARHDDPIWDVWMPQNGHRCRCSVISLTEAQAEARGISTTIPDAMPDPGWEYSTCATPDEGMKRALDSAKRRVDPRLQQLVSEFEPPRRTPLDEMLAAGAQIRQEIMDGPDGGHADGFNKALLQRLRDEGRIGKVEAKLKNRGEGVLKVQTASRIYPDSWVDKTNRFGDLYARKSKSRPVHYTMTPSDDGKVYRLQSFGVTEVKARDGYLVVYDVRDALHEYGHRIQHAIPELDDYFQQLHVIRTADEPLKTLRKITGNNRYRKTEMAKEDHYVSPYFGKEYHFKSPDEYTGRAGALEVLPMTMEYLLSGNFKLQKLLDNDPELIDLAVGLLFKYDP